MNKSFSTNRELSSLIFHHSAFEGKTRCFTLIELMVVVAIIAILAGMLFPSLSKARKTAKGIACVSNQKQCGTAIAMYGSEQNGYFLMNVPSTTGWLFNPCHEKSIAGYPKATWGRVLANAGYLKLNDAKTTVCSESQVPHDADKTWYYFETTYGANADGYWNNYGAWCSINGKGNQKGKWYFTGTQLGIKGGNEFKLMLPEKAPSDVVMIACVRAATAYTSRYPGFGGAASVWASNDTTKTCYWAVHNRKVNVLFPDMHVGTLGEFEMMQKISKSMKFFYGYETY